MKQITRFFSALTAILILSAPALAEGEAKSNQDKSAKESMAKALEIIKKADKAARKVTAASFKATVTTDGMWTEFMGPTEGESYMEGWDEEIQKPRRFWADIKTVLPGTKTTKRLTGGGDGETFYVIDHDTKKGYEDLDPAVMGTHGQLLVTVGMGSLMMPTPFERDLAAEKIELLGTEDVAGVECFRIKVEYGPGDPEGEAFSVWSISTEDFLPRKRARNFNFGPEAIGGVEVVVHELEINPKIDPGLLTLKLPQGYKQIDDFAP